MASRVGGDGIEYVVEDARLLDTFVGERVIERFLWSSNSILAALKRRTLGARVA